MDGFANIIKLFRVIVFLVSLFSVSYVLAQTTQLQGPMVKIENGKLWVWSDDGEYKPFFIKGVGYQPTPIGRHPSDWGWPYGDPRNNNIYDDSAILNRDFSKLQIMNANTIRLWKGNDTQQINRFPNKLTLRTLILASKYNLKIIAGYWVDDLTFDRGDNIVGRQEIIDLFVDYVNSFKQYSAILLWAIGNENNYNKIDGKPMSVHQLRSWYSLVNDMARAAHEAEGDGFHPVAVVNGDIEHIGDAAYGASDEQLSSLDIWGVNVYRIGSFKMLFGDYQRKSRKPLWISEFGRDAWHIRNSKDPDDGYEDQDSQSDWDAAIWDQIVENIPLTIGGTVMEYSDEWWKPYEWFCVDMNLDQEQNAKRVETCNGTHDHAGLLNSSFPEGYSAEKWYGIMSVERNRFDPKGPDQMKERKVYFNLQKKWQIDPYGLN